MPSREHLQDWVVQALKSMGGSGSIVAVAKHIWGRHESELKAAGDLFCTWQYDMRWACTRLREKKIVQPAELLGRGEWKLT